jgi:hypothetical protein
MALIVEDGTGDPDANSYVSQADASAYLALMGVTLWAALTSDEKDAKLIMAKLLVDDGATYIYDGDRVGTEQSGEWPRLGATYGRTGPEVPSDTIPPEIRRAQIVAAGGLTDGTINSGGSPGSLGESGLVKSKKVDTLEVVYFSPKETGLDASAGTSAGASGPFADLGWPSITAIVAPLLDMDAYADLNPTEAGGIDADVAARRGPMWTRPSYGGIWDVGQNDAVRGGDSELLSNQQV